MGNHSLKKSRYRSGYFLTAICLSFFLISRAVPSYAQRMRYNHQNLSPFSPFFLLWDDNFYDPTSCYLFSQNSCSPFWNNFSWNSWEMLFSPHQFNPYHASCFLPPMVSPPSSGFPAALTWFLPFLGGYRNYDFTFNISQTGSVEEQAADFMTRYLEILDEAEDLTYEELRQKYPEGEYVSALGYDVSQAQYYDLVKSKIGLTVEEETRINADGFVVSTRNSYDSFGYAYLDIFLKDLPVFISTDSILQAWHQSYDNLFAELEDKALIDKLDFILTQAQNALPQLVANPTGLLAEACHDVNIFYAVARRVLQGGGNTTSIPYSGDEKVGFFLIRIMGDYWFEPVTVDIFGESRIIDFSQFFPRGHYTKSSSLQSYFQAMMWLGLVDFRVADRPENSDDLVLNVRQLLDAYLIMRSIEAGGVRSAWDDLDKILEFMVGEHDAMNVRALSMLMEEAGVLNPEDLLDEEIQARVLSIMQEKGYGEQRICSQVMASNPCDPQITPLPRSFAFMGQRFTVDSHVFSNVVYDRIVVNGTKIVREMPSPLDAMFVLGNNRALRHLEGEMAAWPYQGNLYSLRYLVDQYEQEFWESSIYNSWLDVLRKLSAPFTGEEYPKAMRTAAYRDKLLHTQLASWAQLRHDNILYVKQSHTYAFCEYPDGFVEAIPEFYQRLKDCVDTARDIFESVNIPDTLRLKYVNHFGNFSETMDILKTLAQEQLDGQPRTDEETQFIRSIIYDTPCGGDRYSGWYPKLFYGISENSVVPDFLVADVHTNPNGMGQVLHVGVGRVNTIYFTAETDSGLMLYVGPTFSYHEKVTDSMGRVNDEGWAQLVENNSLPFPWWTESFLVP